ncbi:class I SAM-dependent methyltransferase [Arachidicoccus ginsenosidivorans]|jgi:methyltransferase (TIGR00027 family)|uniref:S-adenosyl-L-methionine-dependent methyltransferase n=1 Tax=Arachidicoccus ginsenosidivorans TaxID=496057 RepID=A0A5B8VP94_9BACT|nr:class I SAM-dependent methyltransferase [Arachidicoccus ginsenosidivorans]QEC73447.1 class I SAM-dependent methyltransferase [Arachidicoccus ginsenosidivorans]
MEKPDNTAQRTALWRALHLEIDDVPLIIKDNWALRLTRPAPGWQQRPDMKYTKPIRASIVGRARFVEDQVEVAVQKGLSQYVILGAGLDSFALRYNEQHAQTKAPPTLQVFEIDQPETLSWKQDCIKEQIENLPENLHLLPVDFEQSTWWEALAGQNSGFDMQKPTIISSTGVTLYLTHKAIRDMLMRIAKFAPGSKAIISFYAPIESLQGEDKTLMEMSVKGAASQGTPMISFFNPEDVLLLAKDAGLKNCQIFDTQDLTRQYFKHRSDGLRPCDGELFLVAES